jgi:hypothetical protein
VTDMTYIWTPQGWRYLAVIIDLFSRRVVGWAMSERIDRKLALESNLNDVTISGWQLNPGGPPTRGKFKWATHRSEGGVSRAARRVARGGAPSSVL